MNEREEGYYRIMFLDDLGKFQWDIAYYRHSNIGGMWFIMREPYPLRSEKVIEIIEQRLDPMPEKTKKKHSKQVG